MWVQDRKSSGRSNTNAFEPVQFLWSIADMMKRIILIFSGVVLMVLVVIGASFISFIRRFLKRQQNVLIGNHRQYHFSESLFTMTMAEHHRRVFDKTTASIFSTKMSLLFS